MASAVFFYLHISYSAGTTAGPAVFCICQRVQLLTAPEIVDLSEKRKVRILNMVRDSDFD